MYFHLDDAAKRCEIWIPYENSMNYSEAREYKDFLKKHREQGYSVIVFVGGDSSLSDTLNI